MDKRYKSKEWKELRQIIILRDNNICRLCGTFIVDSKKTGRGAHVDHIKEVKDGGPFFDPNNLQTLCVSCHNKKTRMINPIEDGLVDLNDRKRLL